MSSAAAFAAVRGDGVSASTAIEIAVFCTILLVQGIFHYRGHNKRFLRMLPGRFLESTWFGMAWFGAFGLLVLCGVLLDSVTPVLTVVLAVPAFVAFVVALMSIFWLPERLLPEWYVRWRDHGRPESELLH